MSTTDPIPSIITRLLNTLKTQGSKILDHRLQTNAIGIGYNFCSGIAKLKVHLKRSDGVLEEKSYVFKIPSQCPFYDQLSALNMYRNEVLMYSHILPAISALAECNWIANCYLVPNSDNLVFDDLNVYGYELMDKKSQLDLEHCKLALKTLAKFHALTIKLHEISKETAEVIKVPPRHPTKEGPPSGIFQRMENTVEILGVPERIRLEVRNFVRNNTKKTFDETMMLSEKLNVLCHGDFWHGNMLFKHNHDEEVEEIKVLDYQMAHWCSPVVDLIKFFVTSVKFDVYEANRDVLINESYLETMNGLLESLGSSVRYNRADLDQDMRQYKKYHLYCLGHYLTSVLNEEDPFNHGCNDVKCYTNPMYQNALFKWIKYLDNEHLL